jgi:hypothetical protein
MHQVAVAHMAVAVVVDTMIAPHMATTDVVGECYPCCSFVLGVCGYSEIGE